MLGACLLFGRLSCSPRVDLESQGDLGVQLLGMSARMEDTGVNVLEMGSEIYVWQRDYSMWLGSEKLWFQMERSQPAQRFAQSGAYRFCDLEGAT